jgi:hypothetical protein
MRDKVAPNFSEPSFPIEQVLNLLVSANNVNNNVFVLEEIKLARGWPRR